MTYDYPSILRQAANLTGSVAAHVASGLAVVSEREQSRRMAVCDQCPSYDRDAGRCGACGCYLAIKTRWESGGCPLGKWG